MKSLKTSLTIAAVSIFAASVAAEPGAPSEADLAMIEAELSKQMLDPESTIVSDVMAAAETQENDGGELIWVCGQVRGRNAFGGYSQPRPFIGTINISKNGERTFSPDRVAGSGGDDKHFVDQLCDLRVRG